MRTTTTMTATTTMTTTTTWLKPASTPHTETQQVVDLAIINVIFASLGQNIGGYLADTCKCPPHGAHTVVDAVLKTCFLFDIGRKPREW
jgi:hypothetical protein